MACSRELASCAVRASRRASSTEVSSVMASTARVTTMTRLASQRLSRPAKAAPQTLPTGKLAAAMPV
ncbi:hypothetical protein D3C78_1138500 [compost metagenome]